VYGMPREAAVRGLPHRTLPLGEIAPALRLCFPGRGAQLLADRQRSGHPRGED
jgi:hypothetical protein